MERGASPALYLSYLSCPSYPSCPSYLWCLSYPSSRPRQHPEVPVPEEHHRSRRRGTPGVRSLLVSEAVDALLSRLREQTGRDCLDVVDLGGGTGGFAVPVAARGHRVVVVDPSPDALAALERRALEAEVADRVTAVQGDAATVVDTVGPDSADLVLCHGVLEHVDDPAAAVASTARVLRPGAAASLLVAQRLGAVLSRAVAGRFAEAAHVLSDPDGRWGPGDPLARRFDEAGVVALLLGTGLRVSLVHGVRVVADLVPGALLDADPAATEALLALERLAGDAPHHPQLSGVAAQLHVVAHRPAVG